MLTENEFLNDLFSRNDAMLHVFQTTLLCAALFTGVILYSSLMPSAKKRRLSHVRPKQSVPFIVLEAPNWKVLSNSLNSYRRETHQALEQLSMALEVSMAEEDKLGLLSGRFSDYLSEKIERLSDLYDSDLQVLAKRVVVPFTATLSLPNEAKKVVFSTQASQLTVNDAGNSQQRFTWSNTNASRFQDPYDSVRQVIAHLVRDWSSDGAILRKALYGWCILQLQNRSVPSGPVLVPGAGLGRLAWEIAFALDRSVEAVEFSLSMAAAANSIFNYDENMKVSFSSKFSLHPYSADAFRNEVNSKTRYDRVSIPDVDVKLSGGSLSYTVGSFQIENFPFEYYASVVTCFFLDTATTLYDYLTTISAVLMKGGYFINIGPLQWHRNGLLPVSVDELRMIIESMGVFEIILWTNRDIPINYRDDHRRKSTHHDAYCPLQFVLQKK
jgi:N2227-like protein